MTDPSDKEDCPRPAPGRTGAAGPSSTSDFAANSKIFTREKYEKARARMLRVLAHPELKFVGDRAHIFADPPFLGSGAEPINFDDPHDEVQK